MAAVFNKSLSALYLEESLTEPEVINSASLDDKEVQGPVVLRAMPLY